MKMNVLKIIALTLTIIIIFTISEAIFYFKNPEIFFPAVISTNKALTGNGTFPASSFVFAKTAELTVKKNKKIFPVALADNFDPAFLYGRTFQDIYKDYLDQATLNKLSEDLKFDHSKIFYDLALLSFKRGDKVMSQNLLTATYYLNPTFGYWAIELANFYYYSGDKNGALEILSKCQSVPAPTQQCREYEALVNNGSSPNEPGFLDEEIDKYFKSTFSKDTSSENK
jgi:hypothetical protein